MKNTSLILSVPGGVVTLAAAGRRSVRSLAALAGLMGLACSAPAGRPDVLLTDEIPPDGEEIRMDHRNEPPFYLLPDRRFAAVSESGFPFHLSCDWPMLLALGALRKLLAGEMLTTMHGALLEPMPGRGVVLFGPGGVGKSTTVCRFRAAGGTARADDMLLLGWRRGVLTANPLPTRSWYLEHWSPRLRCPFMPGVTVERLLLLERGTEREEIVGISRDRWLAALTEAMTMHTACHVRRLAPELRRRYGGAALDFALKLSNMFPPSEFRAELGADIMKTLNVSGGAPC